MGVEKPADSKSSSSLSPTSLAPLGALTFLLSPWGWSTLKALMLEPIRLNPPVWLRVLFGLLVITNYRATPFGWHIRIWIPAFQAYIRARKWFGTSESKDLSVATVKPQFRLKELPIGRNIFEDVSSYNFTATLDECDWNGHLSNSSYSKSLDYTRMHHNSDRFLKMAFDGAWVALGGSAFNFHREIPVLSRYTVRMCLEAWDDKWLYLVGRFVEPAKSSSNKVAAADAAADADLQGLLPGDKLYCTSISRYVCKSNRRTIPPWLMIATAGYGPNGSANWDKADKLRAYYLDKERKAYMDKTGKKTISSKVEAKLIKKAALLKQFLTEGERKGTEDEAWMSKTYWAMDEWEPLRKQGLQRLGVTVGVLPAVEK